MVNVVDINDICVIADGEGQQLRSPGYVLLQKGQEPVVGESALRQSRLSPAATASRFWRDLSLNPAGVSHPQVRHQADLVWHQIKQINTEVPLSQSLFLCPSHYGEEQLSLLSGILKAQQIAPSALVKRALAAAIANTQAEWHLEFQLHQTLLTAIKQKNGEVVAADTRALAGEGLSGAVDAMLKTIQKRFIKETRFDPLHHAGTEQQLVDSLPEALQQLLTSDTAIVHVSTDKEDYRAEIRRDELAQALSFLWNEINSAVPAGSKVQVDQSLFELPGFSSLDITATAVSHEALAEAANRLPIPETFAPDAPIYITRAKVDFDPTDTSPAAPPEPSPAKETEPATRNSTPAEKQAAPNGNSSAATHLLSHGLALGGANIWIGVSANGRLMISTDRPEQTLAHCTSQPEGLEIEARGDIQINGEKLVGRRTLQLSDHLSSLEIPGGVTAIRVAGDAD